MEVSTEEAQAVLLEGMEGTQYITIQRGDSDTLNKGVSLLTLNGELISEGMVVDMINAGVASEYSAGTHFYETDDLLSHELTEEDRRLAAALVAVQLQQQQKQQLHSQSQHDDPSLPDVSQLETLTPVNAYTIQSMPETDPPPVYPTLQQQQHQQQQQQQQQRHHHQQQQPTYKRISQNVKQEFINVKSEYDIDVSAESSEDTAPTTPGPKRSLPHKKRIPRKLKQQSTAKKSTTRKDSNRIASELQSIEPVKEVHMFKCELCTSKFGSQLKFFEHLKAHYEPVKQESRIAQATNTNITISIQESIQTLDNTVIEEFSEPEDIMEGIRGVVEETGAHIDEDGDTLASNDEATLWTIADVTSQQPNARDNSGNADNAKRKKPTKSRKSANELTCPECDRTFHHKNSLVYHMRSHSGERPHQCEVCGKSFFAASALKVHKRLHSGDKPYKCEECGRHFRQWGDLKYHSTSIHSEQKQYQCEYCGKDFARKYSLIVHRRIHTGEKNYRCEYCSKTFRASSYLQNHRRIHTGEKPHACTVCGKPFRVRSDMKRHMHTHSRNRNTERSSNSKIGKASGEKNENNGVITTANLQRDDTANSPQKIQHTQHQHHQIKGNNAQRTIQDLVRDLKLEVEANGVVEIVPPDDNPESILPHSGTQTLEYTTTNPERDPLESVERTSDSLQYFFM